MKNIKTTFPFLMKVLLLNLPLFALVIMRFIAEVSFSPLVLIYIVSLLFGYYFIAFFLLIIPAIFTSFFYRISVTVAWFILSMLLLYFVLDSVVYGVYKFHINLFFIEIFFTDFGSYGFTTGMILLALLVIFVIFFIEYSIFKFAKKISNKYLYLIIPFVLLYVFSQLIHIYAFANDRGDITNITVRMALYFPIQSEEIANKHREFGVNLGLEEKSDKVESISINYPKEEIHISDSIKIDSLSNIIFIVLESWRYDALDSLICPNIFNLSKKSLLANNHFSTGNATTAGLFGLFYGIHPTYWEAVKANSSVIDNPVFIDLLKENNYDFGIYSNSSFERLKIASTVFNNIEIHKDFDGKGELQKDRDKNNLFIEFLEGRKTKDNPFFGFVFYKSTHHAYHSPEKHQIFKPTGRINLGLVNNSTNSAPFFNAYKNSIHYIDELVNDILKTLKESELDKNTIIVLTSDHGEEFNDNEKNYWGHGSNFTRFQSGVPLMIYFPNKKSLEVSMTTSHIDVIPTLLQEGFKVKSNINLYSNGKNIYKLKEKVRPVIVSSYVNHGLIIDQNVYAVYPFALKKYNLYDIKKSIGKTNQKLFRRAVDEMNWFYK